MLSVDGRTPGQDRKGKEDATGPVMRIQTRVKRSLVYRREATFGRSRHDARVTRRMHGLVKEFQLVLATDRPMYHVAERTCNLFNLRASEPDETRQLRGQHE